MDSKWCWNMGHEDLYLCVCICVFVFEVVGYVFMCFFCICIFVFVFVFVCLYLCTPACWSAGAGAMVWSQVGSAQLLGKAQGGKTHQCAPVKVPSVCDRTCN